jgi:signal transduction histidine kinase
VAPDLPPTWGNKTKLLQVFLNLISNAIKYNDKEAGLVRITGWHAGDEVRYCVEDNGLGIPPALRA